MNLPFTRYPQNFKLRFFLQIVTPPDFLPSDDWTPLIVIGNRKSGSKETSAILANFRAQLNPAQVRPISFENFSQLSKYVCHIETNTYWFHLNFFLFYGSSKLNKYCLKIILPFMNCRWSTWTSARWRTVWSGVSWSAILPKNVFVSSQEATEPSGKLLNLKV